MSAAGVVHPEAVTRVVSANALTAVTQHLTFEATSDMWCSHI